MADHLVVINPFADYQRGDRISDQSVVATVLASNNASNVVPVAALDDQPPATAPQAE